MKVLVWLFIILNFISSTCYISQASCNTQKQNYSFIVMQIFEEFEPGMPKVVHHYSIHNNGQGQKALLQDNQIKKMSSFDCTMIAIPNLDSINDNYLVDEPPDLLIEGDPKIIKFIIYQNKKIKIIECHETVMPEILSLSKNSIEQMAASSTAVKKKGTYLNAQLLRNSEEKEVLSITKPIEIDSLSLDMKYLSYLYEALESPFLYLHIPITILSKLKSILHIKDINHDFKYLKYKNYYFRVQFYHCPK